MKEPTSEESSFWDQRYASGRVPWDHRGVPVRLAEFLARNPAGGRAFVPGCGAAYEVRALHDAGWSVLGLDFSAVAIARARAVLGPCADRVHQGDVFAPEPDLGRFDLVYERTFLCALPPRLHAAYAARMAELLVPGGRLAGFFFHGPEDEPPPYPLPPPQLAALLQPSFEWVETREVPDSLPLYAGKETWQMWRRR
jgi:hypothetical protein